MAGSLPLVGVSACRRMVDGHATIMVAEKYVRPLVEAFGALPFVVPPLGGLIEPARLVALLDGLLITGSPSMVHPAEYDGPEDAPGTLHDRERDATMLPLIRAAVAAGLPVLAICRGIQELNVALGGTLHQQLPEDALGVGHRPPPPDLPLEERYGPRHGVTLAPGGALRRLIGVDAITVNSLHEQAIDRLAPGLAVEATAEDGVVEAVRIEGATGFAIGVQWHPEFGWRDNPASRRLFGGFAEAVTQRAERRHGLGN